MNRVLGSRDRQGAVVLTLVCAWFIYLTWPTLSIGFHLDDISNLYRGWEPSWRELLIANLSPLSTIYRPFGGLYYRFVYSVAGLDPFYFRLVTICFLTLNIVLVFLLTRRLFGRNSVAALSALLFALGHLPAAQAMAGALTAPVVAFVLVGNTAFGLVAGWLFARRGLEAAIIAHGLAHLLSHPLL